MPGAANSPLSVGSSVNSPLLGRARPNTTTPPCHRQLPFVSQDMQRHGRQRGNDIFYSLLLKFNLIGLRYGLFGK